jgi:hypothetical protein
VTDQIISIEPANPLDVKPEELTSFIEELQAVNGYLLEDGG